MEHSVEEYLRRLPTQNLEKFLQNYLNGEGEEDFSNIIDVVVQELARRKGEVSVAQGEGAD